MKRVIQIKTNLLTIVIVFVVLLAMVMLYLSNGVQNLFFASLSADQVRSVMVYQQFDEESTLLSESDAKALAQLLQNVRLKGNSVRLSAAESINPQYSVQLNNGIRFDIACYEDHYIINGRGYPIPDRHEDNYAAIGRLYMEHLDNREYFPRTTDGED